MAEGFLFSDVSKGYYSPEQLGALGRTVVGIAGAGGIGSNCGLILARSGVSRFVVADFDRVSLSNLNRQAYTPGQIGRLKVECLRENMCAINPDISVAAHPVRIEPATLHGLFDGCDVIVEAFDDAAAKALLFGEYLHSGKLLVGASGIAGIGKSNRIAIRSVNETCFIVGDGRSAVGMKNLPYAPRVITAAAKMADIVLEYIVHNAVHGR